MDDIRFEFNIKERIINPDRLILTRWEETESTFIWKIENFISFKKSFKETPIQVVLGNLKNHEDVKLILKIEYSKTNSKYYYGLNLKEYYLNGSLSISSLSEINKLVIHTYIVGEIEEKYLNKAEVSEISANSEKSISLFAIDDYAIDYKRYLKNDIMTLAFLVTELKIQSN